MRWLYDEEFIAQVFLALAVATPVLALVGYLIHSRFVGGRSRGARVMWGVFGLAGPLNYGLWPLFNAIEDHYGLDSVRALLINVGLFVLLGLFIGLVIRILLRTAPVDSPPPPAGAVPVTPEPKNELTTGEP